MAAPNALKALASTYIENKVIFLKILTILMLFPSFKMTMKSSATNNRNLNCHIFKCQIYIYIADRDGYNRDNLC